MYIVVKCHHLKVSSFNNILKPLNAYNTYANFIVRIFYRLYNKNLIKKIYIYTAIWLTVMRMPIILHHNPKPGLTTPYTSIMIYFKFQFYPSSSYTWLSYIINNMAIISYTIFWRMNILYRYCVGYREQNSQELSTNNSREKCV